jgi:hypothetical protein
MAERPDRTVCAVALRARAATTNPSFLISAPAATVSSLALCGAARSAVSQADRPLERTETDGTFSRISAMDP